jgi:hypothetical protein
MARDQAIDAMRGLAIVSMVAAHTASGSWLHRLTHFPVWADAAFAFVFLSGLVLGIVSRRARDARGKPAALRMLRRAAVLYVVQLGLLLIALVVSSIAPRASQLPDPDRFGGWADVLFLAGTLQLPARELDILPMYVVLMLAAALAVVLLHRGLAWLVLTISAAVYAVSLVIPAWTVMPYLRADPQDQFNWAAWQLPFIGALVIGWFWRSAGLSERIRTRAVLIPSLVVVAAGLVLARAVVWNLVQIPPVPGRLLAKFDLGPGVILFGVAGLIVIYAAASALLRWRWAARAIRWSLDVIGRRSLDSFVILCLAVILIPAVFPYAEARPEGNLVAFGVLLVAWAWALLRDRWSRRRGSRATPKELGWTTGLEPATSGTTSQRSTN